MDDRHLRGKLGEEGRFLHRAVTATDDDEVSASEKESITGGAGRDPMPGETRLVFQADRHGCRTGCDDERLGLDRPFTVDGQRERALIEIDGGDVAGDELRPEPLRLSPHFLHEFRAHDALWKPGIVFDVCGRRQLAARLPALDEEGRHICPRAVKRCGETCRPGADDDHVAHVGNLAQREKGMHRDG